MAWSVAFDNSEAQNTVPLFLMDARGQVAWISWKTPKNSLKSGEEVKKIEIFQIFHEKEKNQRILEQNSSPTRPLKPLTPAPYQIFTCSIQRIANKSTISEAIKY